METLESLAIRVEQQAGDIKAVRQLLTEIRDRLATRTDLAGNLILGRFRPGERIRMKDHRLYEGPGAPFPSYNQVLHAKRKGCPFSRPDDVRIWSILAEDLENWLTASSKEQPLIPLM